MGATLFGQNHVGSRFSFPAGENLSSTHYRIVTVNSDAKAMLADAGEPPLGYIVEGVAENETQTTYSLAGEAPITAGGAFSIGNYLKGTTDGKLIVEASPTTRTANTLAVALQAASTDGDVVRVAFL